MKKDYLAKIRNGENLTTREQMTLVAQLALPAMMANLSSILMQYIDSAMVGRLGANDSASIGLVSTSTWLFGSLCLASSVGFTVQVAQRIGGKDNEGAKAIMHVGYKTSLILVAFFVAVGLLIAPHLPVWLGGSTDIVAGSSRYFTIYILFLPVVLLRYMTGALLQATGNMRTPAALNVALCFGDVIFNYLFIYGFGLGVIGAALGTGVSEVMITVLMFVFLGRSPILGRQVAAATGRGTEFVRDVIKRALRIAIPVAAESVITCGAQITTTRIVAPLGTYSIAANSFSVTVESLCYMPCYGIGAAATTVIGQSVGAGRRDMAKRLGWLMIGLAAAVLFVTGTGMYVFAPVLIGLLSPVPQIRALGTAILRIEAFAEPLYGTSIVASYVFRGAGDTLMPTAFTLFSMWAIRIPLSAVLAGSYGLRGVWFAMAFELCIRGLLFLIRMKRGRWIEKEV